MITSHKKSVRIEIKSEIFTTAISFIHLEDVYSVFSSLLPIFYILWQK